MIVNDLKKSKNNKYLVTIDNKEYEFCEDIILKYRLVQGKEIDSHILNEAINNNDLSKYYNKALLYALKYGKSEKEIYYYLFNFELNNSDIFKIIKRLKENKAINDELLAKSLVESLVRNYNGKLMIKEKLKNKQITDEIINNSLNDIDDDIYMECLNKLYLKTIDKYKKENDDYIRKQKIKRYLYQRGYSSFDIEKIMK